MSSLTQTPATSERFKSILDTALREYKSKTGKDLLDNWFATELQTCNTIEKVLDKIQHLAEAFDKSRGNKKLMKWIDSSVHVLYTISATLGDGVGMVHPPAKVVFTGIGVLLAAAKDVKASHDALVDLFERIQFFLKRLGVHTQISPTEDMVEILVKIMAEVISVISIATKEMQRSRTKKILKKLVGWTDIEDALKRLDNLTQEEVRMAIAQVLTATSELKDGSKKANEAMQRIADDVGKIKDNLGEMKWNQIKQNIRKWFSPPDPSVNYNIAQEFHQEGTAAWFFKGGVFKEWELIGPLLWIYGKPGSGKSILCSAIIKHVISLRDAGHASLAFFFFDFRDKEKKQDVRNFLTSLLIQLSARSDRCREIITHIYATHGKGTEQPSISTLTKCLHEMLIVEAQQPTYIIIDALDECPNISGLPTQQSVLLDLLEDIVNLRVPNLHICVTSRPEIDIKFVLDPLAYGVVSLNDEDGQKKDISDYVNVVVKNIRGWRDADRKLVVEVLSEKADGMFRWVFCQLEVLRRCLPALIRQTLDRLPKSLDVTYANILGQIPEENQAHAHRMLLCLMVAIRPLRVEELAEVLAFDFDSTQDAIPKYRADWRPSDQVHAVQSTCSSLITIVDEKNGTRVVQFSHFSVKEFLMSDRLTSSHGGYSQYRILPRPAHTTLARACLGSLLLSDDDIGGQSIKSFPLSKYAAEHWVTHAQFEGVASLVKDGMETLFDCDKPHFAAWVRIYNIEKRPAREETPTPLYYSSRLGFSELVEHLAVKHPQHVNTIGGWYEFPLRAALAGKYVGVTEILLKHGADVNVQGREKRTALHQETADFRLVRLLLSNGADVNCRQADLRTPLHLVALYGRVEVARVLLEHKADVNSRDKMGNTPLHLVARRKNRSQKDGVGIARVLLEHGVDANAQENNKWTPLHEAAFGGRLEIAQVLLEHGANMSAENEQGETPLHIVTQGKYRSQKDGVGIVRLLLERGMDVNAQENGKWTPLHMAAFGGRLEIAQVLIEHGAKMNAVNERGETPLHHVTRGKYDSQEQGVGVVRLLLEHGMDVNAQKNNKLTPLHMAAFNGRLEIAQVLLDHGAKVNGVNGWGDTPLHMVTRGKYDSEEQGVGIARLLLERGADVNAQRNNKLTPLHLAAFNGRLEIAQVLLEHGANTDAVNERGDTPLHMVTRGKYGSQEQGVGIARLLLERGVDVNAQENDKLTPLHLAAFNGRLEIAQALLDHGANTNAVDEWGETPLHLVTRGKYDSQAHGVGIVQLLLEHGVDVNAQKNNKLTPLHLAALNGQPEIAQVLLDHRANMSAENEHGETPLHIVTRGKYDSQEDGVGVARMLLERGVNANAMDKDQNTPLHVAAFNGRPEIARVLLDHGAKAGLENDQKQTPLHLVSQAGYWFQDDSLGVAKLLLERGADMSAQDKDYATPLHLACCRGRLDIARVLLEYDAKAQAEND